MSSIIKVVFVGGICPVVSPATDGTVVDVSDEFDGVGCDELVDTAVVVEELSAVEALVVELICVEVSLELVEPFPEAGVVDEPDEDSDVKGEEFSDDIGVVVAKEEIVEEEDEEESEEFDTVDPGSEGAGDDEDKDAFRLSPDGEGVVVNEELSEVVRESGREAFDAGSDWGVVVAFPASLEFETPFVRSIARDFSIVGSVDPTTSVEFPLFVVFPMLFLFYILPIYLFT